jgi:hypothetical protein
MPISAMIGPRMDQVVVVLLTALPDTAPNSCRRTVDQPAQRARTSTTTMALRKSSTVTAIAWRGGDLGGPDIDRAVICMNVDHPRGEYRTVGIRTLHQYKDLRRGCLHAHRDGSGRVYRYKVVSRAFKGENDPRGVEATWVIGAPAARAIRVLERLQPPETDLLFAHHTLWGRANQLRGGQTRALTSGWTVTQLNAFTTWINDYCTDHGRNDGIPLVNGRPWKLTTPQFRRLLPALAVCD